MPTVRDYQEIRKAFTQLLTSDSIAEDKEEMEFLIDAFAKHVSLHSTCAVKQFLKSVVREIRTLRSVGTGDG